MSSLHAVLPVKSFDRAKTRLSRALPATARAELSRRLFERALGAVLGCPAIEGVIVATNGDEVAALCQARGVPVLRDPSEPAIELPRIIDRALAQVARRGASDALVLMADLPHVSASELSRVLDRPAVSDVLLVPDVSGRGTNAMCLPAGAGFRTHFGASDSRDLHEREAARRGLSLAVLECDAIALDLDRPEDLARLSELRG